MACILHSWFPCSTRRADQAIVPRREVLGARQSGLPEYRIAEVPGFADLLTAARDDARLVLGQDPQLATPRGQALRVLLYLFECDDAVRLFHAA